MGKIYISDIHKHVGKEVEISGWLYGKRSSGKLHFLQVRDGSETIQCVIFKGDVLEEVFEAGDKVTQESSVIVKGVVKEDKRSKIGFEIGVSDFSILQMATDYPITPKEHGVAYLLDKRHLWLRSAKQHAIIKVRATIVKAIRDYFDNNGFTLVDTPIFTPAACEGTTTLFETDYFGEKAYLTQSGQLYNEANAMAHGKVYCFGPTFRAEKSKTRRHLMEFWMVEPEMAFVENEENMDVAEDFVEYVVQTTLETRKKELETLERDFSKLEKVKKPFPRISYDEAVKILNDKGIDFKWGGDFGAEDETVLGEHFDKPIMVYDWPKEVKAFYMKEDPKDSRKVKCFDMIGPEGYGELIGASQREDDLDKLVQKIKEHNLPMEAFDWYLDLRKYGSVPHSGFGLGLERTVAWICGIHHVRETTAFPRMLERLKP
ncbi:MAG: asparagine--tRNA ligase [Pseudomonadota bacterium]